ncbi:MAG: PilZ domain-containing protein [Elusimicrobiota bacterium]
MNKNNKNRGKEKRKFIRVNYSIPVTVETSDVTYQTGKGELKNISADGAMIEVPCKLCSGLLVKVKLDMEKKVEPLVGYVKWQKKYRDNYHIGIKFADDFAEQNDRAVITITQKIIDKNENPKN